MRNKILVVGENSSLAKEFLKLVPEYFKIISTNKSNFNFLEKNVYKKLEFIINKNQPDFIVNFVGYFSNDRSPIIKFFTINTFFVWHLIKYYIKKKTSKKVTLIIIGSSAYKGPRKNYILYAASKAALNSLTISAQEYFKFNKNIKIEIINPRPMHSKMNKKFKQKKKSLSFYAKKILNLIIKN